LWVKTYNFEPWARPKMGQVGQWMTEQSPLNVASPCKMTSERSWNAEGVIAPMTQERMTAQVTWKNQKNLTIPVQANSLRWRSLRASEMTLTTRASMTILETEVKERRGMSPRTTAHVRQSDGGIGLALVGVIVKGNVLMNHESDGLTLNIETDQGIEIDEEKVQEIAGGDTAAGIVLRDADPEVDIEGQDQDLVDQLVGTQSFSSVISHLIPMCKH